MMLDQTEDELFAELLRAGPETLGGLAVAAKIIARTATETTQSPADAPVSHMALQKQEREHDHPLSRRDVLRNAATPGQENPNGSQ